jgi:hypothetical protein
MFNLPKETEYNSKLTKVDLLRNARLSDIAKKQLNNVVKEIRITNALKEGVTNLMEVEKVKEILILLITLKHKENIDKLILEMNRYIPYHTVCVVAFDNKYKSYVANKATSLSNENNAVVKKLYFSKWQKEIDLSFSSNNLKEIYDNYIKNHLKGLEDIEIKETNIEKVVEIHEEVQELKKKIERLNKLINKEPQYNKQIPFYKEKQELEERLNELIKY